MTPAAVGYVIQYAGQDGLQGECSVDGLVDLASLLDDLHSRGFRATASCHGADPSALRVQTGEAAILAEFLVCTDANPCGRMRARAASPAFRIDRQGPHVIEGDA